MSVEKGLEENAGVGGPSPASGGSLQGTLKDKEPQGLRSFPEEGGLGAAEGQAGGLYHGCSQKGLEPPLLPTPGRVPSEQVLHLWLEVLCSSLPTVEKWYQPWSFLRSPGWVQIKCELRVLCCFAFSLSQDWELPAKREAQQPLKEGVRDMLVKHHLFSWDVDG